MSVTFEIVETEGRGKVVVAAKDLLPGTLLFHESPLLVMKSDDHVKDAMGALNLGVNPAILFNAFKDLPKDKLDCLFSLYWYVPQTIKDQIIRDLNKSGRGDLASWVIQIFGIYTTNAFGIDEVTTAIYDTISRMSHSCSPNCARIHRGTDIECRTIAHVRAGEELTISYMIEMEDRPTFQRRFTYLRSKNFTCHCPRCDAEGDDTRQFDCFDPKCQGSHLACEPIRPSVPLQSPELQYTGVEYVEPHLLPCTVCQRSPPPEYQTAMFAHEERLQRLITESAVAYSSNNHRELARLFHEIVAVPVGRTSIHRSQVMQSYWAMASINPRHHGRPDIRPQLRAAIAANEAVFPYPSARTRVLYGYLFSKLMTTHPDLVYARKYLRSLLVEHGRNSQEIEVCEAIVTALRTQAVTGTATDTTPQPTASNLSICAFCEESPLQAALTLSVCGRCRKVAYCSKGCQKAHWAMHKQECQT